MSYSPWCLSAFEWSGVCVCVCGGEVNENSCIFYARWMAWAKVMSWELNWNELRASFTSQSCSNVWSNSPPHSNPIPSLSDSSPRTHPIEGLLIVIDGHFSNHRPSVIVNNRHDTFASPPAMENPLQRTTTMTTRTTTTTPTIWDSRFECRKISHWFTCFRAFNHFRFHN